MALLELTGVGKAYGGAGSAAAVSVLEGVSFTVDAGASVAIVGPSGCGKSTLLNIMGALDSPTAGAVRFAGQAVEAMDEAARSDLRSREIGFVFQQHWLLPSCTVLENVLVPTLASRATRAARAGAVARAGALLDRVGLGHRLSHRPGQLSGGESQRVAVVRAMINEPRLLLADEPTGSLDAASAAALGDLLVDLNRSGGVTLIVVTHSPELARRMDRVYNLRNGRLME